MNKPKYTKRIFRYVILAIGVCCVGAQSAPGITLETGRDNPFAKLAKKNTTPQNVRNTSGLDDGTPELFLQTVTLKFLNAQSLEGVIGGLCSGYGSIATDAKTNSLIICDTKERLEKILAQIRRAEETMTPLSFAIEDQNGPNLFVETVTLKFLDATNLGIAVKKMSSEYGSISVDKNSNSLIVCDTKRNLEMILVQIRKADKTPEQIRVEVVIADVVRSASHLHQIRQYQRCPARSSAGQKCRNTCKPKLICHKWRRRLHQNHRRNTIRGSQRHRNRRRSRLDLYTIQGGGRYPYRQGDCYRRWQNSDDNPTGTKRNHRRYGFR
jgi:hypothetical protein